MPGQPTAYHTNSLSAKTKLVRQEKHLQKKIVPDQTAPIGAVCSATICLLLEANYLLIIKVDWSRSTSGLFHFRNSVLKVLIQFTASLIVDYLEKMIMNFAGLNDSYQDPLLCNGYIKPVATHDYMTRPSVY